MSSTRRSILLVFLCLPLTLLLAACSRSDPTPVQESVQFPTELLTVPPTEPSQTPAPTNSPAALMNPLTGDTFYRDPDRQSYGIEHSLFGSGPLIVQSAQEPGYPETHSSVYDVSYSLRFRADAHDQCTEPAGFVEVAYAGGKTTSFAYDESSGLYTAYQYGGIYADDGQTPMTFTNVFVLNANTYL